MPVAKEEALVRSEFDLPVPSAGCRNPDLAGGVLVDEFERLISLFPALPDVEATLFEPVVPFFRIKLAVAASEALVVGGFHARFTASLGLVKRSST